MVLHDHQETTVRILLVIIELFLLCNILNSGSWRNFNFQGQIQFQNCQINHERFNSLLVISPIKFCDRRELRKTQS